MEQEDLKNLVPSDDEDTADEREVDNADEEETASDDEEALLQGTDFMSPAFRGRG